MKDKQFIKDLQTEMEMEFRAICSEIHTGKTKAKRDKARSQLHSKWNKYKKFITDNQIDLRHTMISQVRSSAGGER